MQTILRSLIFNLTISIEHLYERMSILRKKYLINERYTCGKIGADGIQIRGEVGAHVFLDAGDWSQLPRVLTHWKFKKDGQYTVIYIYIYI